MSVFPVGLKWFRSLKNDLEILFQNILFFGQHPVLLRESYRVPQVELKSVTYKASTLPDAPSLLSLSKEFMVVFLTVVYFLTVAYHKKSLKPCMGIQIHLEKHFILSKLNQFLKNSEKSSIVSLIVACKFQVYTVLELHKISLLGMSIQQLTGNYPH